MGYVEIAIARLHTGNKTFTYETTDKLAIGTIVQVVFGTKKAWGIVTNIVKKPTFKTKKITTSLSYQLPSTSLDLMTWMFGFYADDSGLITQLFLPTNLAVKPHQQQAKLLNGQNKSLPTATAEQQQALTIMSQNNVNRVLLHGDTASGKTRVFMDKARDTIAAGRSVLILTPEIGLTPQLLSDLGEYLNAPISLTHSALTPAERRRVWEYALSHQQPTVFVGPRSALFLPFHDIGLIVIDEAHDSSYKQLQSPRYQSLHIAAKLANLHQAFLIQSTATPNVDNYLSAKNNGYQIVRMTKKAVGDQPGRIELVDLTERHHFNQSAYLSDQLIQAASQALRQQQQVMLFLNRRGSAHLVQCNDCGWQALCPSCGLPLTYHHDFHSIICHTCNFRESAPTACPSCGSTDLSFKSIGTKTLVDQAQRLFPKARIMRFDADSTASEQYYRHIDTLKSGKIDIIIGTQLISKGINLPKLSVVGVINADSGLNLPDFRAEETTFQQLYQVAGRTGRGYLPSVSIIQTRMVDHPVMQAILHRSWQAYYKYELAKRRQFNYPPFCYLAVFTINKKTVAQAVAASQKGYDSLTDLKAIELLGPSPSFYERRHGTYAWQIIVKSKKRSRLVTAAQQLSNDWVIDIDPTSLL